MELEDRYPDEAAEAAWAAQEIEPEPLTAEGITLIRQDHDYGCGIASLAMICGQTYDEVREWLIANWPEGSQTPEAWLTKRGIHKGIADWFLFRHGYVWNTNYAGWWPTDAWPPEPFAPVHLVNVTQPSGNSHYVVMCADGTVLDPMADEPKRLTDWTKVSNVQGIWHLGASSVTPERPE